LFENFRKEVHSTNEGYFTIGKLNYIIAITKVTFALFDSIKDLFTVDRPHESYLIFQRSKAFTTFCNFYLHLSIQPQIEKVARII
jgi:hypothetical protein